MEPRLNERNYLFLIGNIGLNDGVDG